MQAYELSNKPGLQSLTLIERPEPVPGPGQVVLKVRAVSLNYRDLLIAKRTYAATLDVAPIVPVSDGVGEIVGVGDGVTRAKIGDRVAGAFMQGWISGELTPEKAGTALGGGTNNGMLAKYVVLHQDGIVHVPAHLSDEEAATLPCAGVTAWYALFVGGNLQAGNTVLLLGTGGVSLFSLQFAKMAGARVILTSSSDEKLKRGRQLGADETINYKANPNWAEQVVALTHGRGVDYVVEVGGPGTINKSLHAVRYGGTISLMGVLTGLSSDVSTSDILHKNVRVQGVYVGSREMFEAMNCAISVNEIRPVVDRIFPFREARAAYEYLDSGAHFGKVVIGF